MAEAYDSAAVRHWTDAKNLASTERWDNAGHLIGFAVECAIKHAYGLTEPDDSSPKVHLPDLGRALLKRVRSRNVAHTPLRSLLEQNKDGFFHDWTVNARYYADGAVTRRQYEKWQDLARRALGAAGIKQ